MSIQALTSRDMATIERLVSWKSMIKHIASLMPFAKTESYARNIYRVLGVSPPCGMPGSAASERATKGQIRGYVGLSINYQRMIAMGCLPVEAKVSSFRVYKILHSNVVTCCDVNLWLSLARDLDAQNAGIYECAVCSGGHLWQQGVFRFHKRCIWCDSPIVMPMCATKAANASPRFKTKIDASASLKLFDF